jgi:hypothetical protein
MSVFDLACLFVGLCCEHSVRWPLASSHSTKLNAKESPDYTHYPGKLLQLLLQNSLQLPSNGTLKPFYISEMHSFPH